VAADRDVFGTVEIARMLQVSPATAVNWIRAGRIPAYKTPGGHRRVRRDDLVKFVRANDLPMPAELSAPLLKVLVVDDDPGVRDTVTAGVIEILGENAVETRTAADGTSGLIEVGRWNPDVLVLDIFLPAMDGFEVCRRIRQHGGIGLKILAISGREEEWVREKALEAGADSFFQKPFPIEELVRAARSASDGALP